MRVIGYIGSTVTVSMSETQANNCYVWPIATMRVTRITCARCSAIGYQCVLKEVFALTDGNEMSDEEIKALIDAEMDKLNLPKDIREELKALPLGWKPERQPLEPELEALMSWDSNLKLGRLSTEWLPLPEGAVHAFVAELALGASDTFNLYASGCTFASYSKKELIKIAKRFAKRKDERAAQLLLWIGGLPWDEDGNVTLVFNE